MLLSVAQQRLLAAACFRKEKQKKRKKKPKGVHVNLSGSRDECGDFIGAKHKNTIGPSKTPRRMSHTFENNSKRKYNYTQCVP